MNKSFSLTALLFLAGPTLITCGDNDKKKSAAHPYMVKTASIANEIVMQEFLRANFSAPISTKVNHFLLDGDDMTALSATIGTDLLFIMNRDGRKPMKENGDDEPSGGLQGHAENGDGKKPGDNRLDDFTLLGKKLAGKYVGRKLVPATISATNWCYGLFSDNKDLIDVKKHENTIKRATDAAGLVGSATSVAIISYFCPSPDAD